MKFVVEEIPGLFLREKVIESAEMSTKKKQKGQKSTEISTFLNADFIRILENLSLHDYCQVLTTK